MHHNSPSFGCGIAWSWTPTIPLWVPYSWLTWACAECDIKEGLGLIPHCDAVFFKNRSGENLLATWTYIQILGYWYLSPCLKEYLQQNTVICLIRKLYGWIRFAAGVRGRRGILCGHWACRHMARHWKKTSKQAGLHVFTCGQPWVVTNAYAQLFFVTKSITLCNIYYIRSTWMSLCLCIDLPHHVLKYFAY